MTKEAVNSIPGVAFLREVRAELKKVTWPTKKQVWGSLSTWGSSIFSSRGLSPASWDRWPEVFFYFLQVLCRR